ncbi:MAG: sugar phosphate isomerase/epimerase, partial [Deinococcota bacterium]
VQQAESCHAKASFAGGQIQHKDYQTCLDLTKGVNFQGPYTLIFDSPEPNEWQGLDIEKDIVQAYVS